MIGLLFLLFLLLFSPKINTGHVCVTNLHVYIYIYIYICMYILYMCGCVCDGMK